MTSVGANVVQPFVGQGGVCYGVGEMPLCLLNQIEAEEREIQRIDVELKQLDHQE